MSGFFGSWLICLVVLSAFAAFIGWARTSYGLTGILVDERGRYSLNRCQLVMWTLLVLSTFLGWFFYSARNGQDLKPVFDIPSTLLALMGISVGSATVASAAKNAKDVQGKTQTAGVLPEVTQNPSESLAKRLVAGPDPERKNKIERHFSQVFLQEEGSQIDQVIDVSKFQNFIFTVALGLTYVVLLWRSKNAPSYPNLDDAQQQGHILWLLGISHAGYVAGKLPEKK